MTSICVKVLHFPLLILEADKLTAAYTSFRALGKGSSGFRFFRGLADKLFVTMLSKAVALIHQSWQLKNPMF